MRLGKIGILVNFITQKLKSKRCLSFHWWQVFLGNERKYFTHILILRNKNIFSCENPEVTRIMEPRIATILVHNLNYFKNICTHSVLGQIWIKDSYLHQRLPQHEILYPIGLKSARIDIPHVETHYIDFSKTDFYYIIQKQLCSNYIQTHFTM